MLPLHLVSFGDPFAARARRRLQEQAKAFQVFRSINVLSKRDLLPDFVKRHRKALSVGVRGYGYWVWKPKVILDKLQELRTGENLLFLDVGCHLNPEKKDGLHNYLELLVTAPSGVASSEYWEEERKWTKGDVFDFFGVRDEQSISNTMQRQAGVIFIRKQKDSEDLVRQWLQIAEEYPELVDDSASRSENFPDFVENRHDQSIFSILSKIAGGAVFPAMELEKWRFPKKEKFDLSPIEARRDFRGATWTWANRATRFTRKLLA